MEPIPDTFINPEELPHASSISAGGGEFELELDCELDPPVTRPFLFIFGYADEIHAIYGNVVEYEKVEANPDLAEQEVFSRLKMRGMRVTFTLPETI